MSSNGFLSAPEIKVSFTLSVLSVSRRPVFIGIGVNSAGDWRGRTAQGFQPVLLLRNKSIWLKAIAGLTVKAEKGPAVVLWLLRRDCDAFAWRRLRARVFHAQC
jgi:hypothetical protein